MTLRTGHYLCVGKIIDLTRLQCPRKANSQSVLLSDCLEFSWFANLYHDSLTLNSSFYFNAIQNGPWFQTADRV